MKKRMVNAKVGPAIPVIKQISRESEAPHHIATEPTPHHRNIMRLIGKDNSPITRPHMIAPLVKSCTGSAPKPPVMTARNVVIRQTNVFDMSSAMFEPL
jgi:hypothetical protein